MIYTKKGDNGMTTLIGGLSVSKSSEQIEVYGTLDELNSHIGFLRSCSTASVSEVLLKIQQDIFLVGNLYASDRSKSIMVKTIALGDVSFLEKEIDKIQAELLPLKEFIIPGGSAAAAQCHIARTVCRRAERVLIKFLNTKNSSTEWRNADGIASVYINRLSDYLFVLSRSI